MTDNDSKQARLARDFSKLFEGRQDGYFDGTVDRYYIRDHAVPGSKVNDPLRRTNTSSLSFTKRCGKHLEGGTELGVYPIRPSALCRWWCIDIDHDDRGLAVNTCQTAEGLGLHPQLELSRSKGYHVWGFCSKWIPVLTMYRAVRTVGQQAGLDPKTEFNPKQPHAHNKGNCVRLPYPGTRPEGRMCFIDRATGELMDLESFLESVIQDPPEALDAVAAGCWEPRRVVLAEDWTKPVSGKWQGNVTTADCRAIFLGQREVSMGERDNQIYALCRYMKARDLTANEALSVLERVWERQMEQSHDFPIGVGISKINRIWR